MTETDKVSTAPEDVERLAQMYPLSKETHELQAATLLALSAEVERLKVALRSILKYSSSPHAEKTARAALGE